MTMLDLFQRGPPGLFALCLPLVSWGIFYPYGMLGSAVVLVPHGLDSTLGMYSAPGLLEELPGRGATGLLQCSQWSRLLGLYLAAPDRRHRSSVKSPRLTPRTIAKSGSSSVEAGDGLC